MLEVKNLASFDRSVQDWFSAVRGAAEKAAVGLAKATFTKLLYESPQFSGDFAANWKVDVNRLVPRFDANAIGGRDQVGASFGVAPFKRGDRQAIRYAESMIEGVLDGFRLGGKIYIHNSAAHDEPYAWKIENNQIKFRPENIGSEALVRRTAQYVLNRYGRIGSAQLAILRRFGA